MTPASRCGGPRFPFLLEAILIGLDCPFQCVAKTREPIERTRQAEANNLNGCQADKWLHQKRDRREPTPTLLVASRERSRPHRQEDRIPTDESEHELKPDKPPTSLRLKIDIQ